jgi:hypothetical protein
MSEDPGKRLVKIVTGVFLFSWLGSCSVGLYQLKLNLVLLGLFFSFLFVLGSLVYDRWDKL